MPRVELFMGESLQWRTTPAVIHLPHPRRNRLYAIFTPRLESIRTLYANTAAPWNIQ